MSLKLQFGLNKQIEEFVQAKMANGETYSIDDLAYVNQYAGFGGMWELDTQLPKERGLYEYYTPIEVIEKMMGLMYHYGFKQGKGVKVCEPSCGIGRFLHFIDPNTGGYGYEPDAISHQIAQANFPTFSMINTTFNEIFVDRRGNSLPFPTDFDLVIGNPPYGSFDGRNTATEKTITKAETYVEYFISRGLDLLKKGGLLSYIIPSAYVDGSDNKAKQLIHAKGELLVAYRLPVKTFKVTDIGTDIIVYRKK
jgi:type I restriction-modification system DNA methylase subunit